MRYLTLLLSTQLFSLPQEPSVASGSATVTQDPGILRIEASDKAILNYQSFNIGKGEKVQFVQPHSKASVLNRVQGNNPSSILGQMQGNGRVYLVNPNGVYFGPDSVVNVGSLIVSTLDIQDQDFWPQWEEGDSISVHHHTVAVGSSKQVDGFGTH